MTKIVVGVDGSENSTAALEWALTQAERDGADVEAVLAWSEPVAGGIGGGYYVLPNVEEFRDSHRQQLDGILEEARSKHPDASLKGVLMRDTPAHALLDAAEGADLVVVGSRGHGGFLGLLLGSVSQQIVNHAPCPAVVVPGPPED